MVCSYSLLAVRLNQAEVTFLSKSVKLRLQRCCLENYPLTFSLRRSVRAQIEQMLEGNAVEVSSSSHLKRLAQRRQNPRVCLGFPTSGLYYIQPDSRRPMSDKVVINQ